MPLPTPDLETRNRVRGESAVGCLVKTDGATLTLTTPCRGIYVGDTGTVIVTFLDGSVGTFAAVPTGTLLPVVATSIAGTATSVLALL